MILQSPRVNIQWLFSVKNDGISSVFASLTLYWMQVGNFKRSRTIKGKKAPPSCKEVAVCVFSFMGLVQYLSHWNWNGDFYNDFVSLAFTM